MARALVWPPTGSPVENEMAQRGALVFWVEFELVTVVVVADGARHNDFHYSPKARANIR